MSLWKSELRVETIPYSNGLLEQKVWADMTYATGTQRELVMSQLLDTMDASVRQALMAMGWTPPTPGSARPELGHGPIR